MRLIFLLGLSLAASSFLTACSWGDSGPSSSNQRTQYPIPAGGVSASDPGVILAGPTPKAEPIGRYGNPKSYKALGRSYSTWSWERAKGYREVGKASWYGKKFHGRLTSSREVYDMNRLTAAHKHLPLPCYVRVTHRGNGRSIIVRVNDRGPFAHSRIIDLSRGAATVLGMLNEGVAEVEVVLLEPGTPEFAAAQRRGRPAPQPVAVATTAEIEALRPTIQQPVSLPTPKATPGDIKQLAGARPVLPRPAVRVAPVASGNPVVINEPVAVPVRPAVSIPVAAPQPVVASYPAPRPAPQPIAQVVADHFVQVAMLTKEADAILKASTLVEQGLGPVRMVTTKIASQKVYQVRVGPFPSVGLAEQRQRALAQAGYARTFVLQVDP